MGGFASRGGLFLNAPLKHGSNATSRTQQNSALLRLDMAARKASCESVNMPDMDDSGKISNIRNVKAGEANAESS